MRPLFSSCLRSAVVAAASLLGVASGFSAAPAWAQRGMVLRTVQGKVVDGNNTALKGAVVHLKDVRSLAQKSFITDTDGTFRFGQVSSNTDYEVWAEWDGKKSSTKAISSFESKNTFVLNLEIK